MEKHILPLSFPSHETLSHGVSSHAFIESLSLDLSGPELVCSSYPVLLCASSLQVSPSLFSVADRKGKWGNGPVGSVHSSDIPLLLPKVQLPKISCVQTEITLEQAQA